MEALFECLGKEFGDVGFTSMNINPSHTVNYTKNGKLENIITLTITVYNSYHQNVGKKIIRFINDKYKITPVKKLDNVSVENLESAYLLAKPDIIKEIYNDYGNLFLGTLDQYYKMFIIVLEKLNAFIELSNNQEQAQNE